MSKAKELFNETAICNMQKAMILFKEDTDIIKAELDYAEKCHNLEEEIGCPLEVLISALNDGIYANRRKYESVEPIEVFDHFYVTFDGSILFNESEYPYNYDELFKVSPVSNEFYISDYKKTWWLKEDRSE